MGIETPDEGSASLGEHNVIAGYFEQNQAEALDLSKTVIDTLFEAVPDWTQTQVRSLLGSFCFSNDAVFKEVGKLSGGEKARLALALMLLMPCNLVVLDEPTNHLDIPAKQMLEDALIEYDGAVLVVSHDRYFISRVANKIVEIRDGELVHWPQRARRPSRKPNARPIATSKRPKQRPANKRRPDHSAVPKSARPSQRQTTSHFPRQDDSFFWAESQVVHRVIVPLGAVRP
jgi:ATP-binding cassette subfamily F protein 3